MATVARTSDAELLLRLRKRDREAWEELYAEYQPRLRGFAYRLAGNVHDADDLVQETFVRAVPRLDRLDPETADVSAYLFTTLRNLFLKQVERTKRQQPMAEVPEPVLPTPIEDDPERGTLLRGQQDEVRLANARLQPRQRLVLALRELEDRSYAEIGELVDMKENAVAQLIFRARESLRLELRLAQVDPERLPEECRRYLPLLAAHLDGQLKGARQEETLAHLESCERCQDALASMQEASKRYRTLFLPGFLETDEARAAVERRLDAAHYWDRPRGRLLVGRTKRSIAAVAAVIALSGGGTALGVALSRDGDPEPAAAAQTTEAEVVVTTSEEIVAPVTEPTIIVAPQTTRDETAASQGDHAEHDDGDNDCAGNDREGNGRDHARSHDDHAEANACAQAETEADRHRAPAGYRGADRDHHAGARRLGLGQWRADQVHVQRGGCEVRLQARRGRLLGVHEPCCLLRARRGRSPFLGPRHRQGRERGQACERRVAVCPAGHDVPHRDAHLDPARLHDGDECELRVHGERARRRFRVLARRGCLRRVRQPGLVPVTRRRRALLCSPRPRCRRQRGAAGELRLVDRRATAAATAAAPGPVRGLVHEEHDRHQERRERCRRLDVDPDDFGREPAVHRAEPRGGRQRDLQLGGLRHWHVCRDRRPDEPRRGVERDEQHREPPQLLLPLIAWDSNRAWS